MNTKADAAENVCDSPATEVSLLSPRRFFLLLLVYFALQTLIRTFLSGTLDLDESEQMILTQKFAWGYGSQPPLYSWLQMLFFHAFGVSVFSLALLKNLLLLGIYFFTYWNVRFVTRSHLCGCLAAFSLLFIPQVAWESQRDLTHSVLASTCVMATIFVFLRLRANSSFGYAMFGFCAGLGVLAKYNYIAFLFGLVLAALTMKRYRVLLANWRIVISVLAASAILFPHVLWALKNPDLLTAATHKFHRQAPGEFFVAVGKGAIRLLLAVASHTGVILLIYAVIFRKSFFKPAEEGNSFATLLQRKFGFILVGLLVMIFFYQVTGFKDRWFEPIFISLPMLFVANLQKQLARPQTNALIGLAGASALLVLLLIPGRILFAEIVGRPQSLNTPYAAMKTELVKMLPAGALILAESKSIGGNLRMQFPDREVVIPELAKFYAPSGRVCVVVWDATTDGAPKKRFVRFLSDFAGIQFADLHGRVVARRFQYFGEKEFHLGVAEISR